MSFERMRLEGNPKDGPHTMPPGAVWSSPVVHYGAPQPGVDAERRPDPARAARQEALDGPPTDTALQRQPFGGGDNVEIALVTRQPGTGGAKQQRLEEFHRASVANERPVPGGEAGVDQGSSPRLEALGTLSQGIEVGFEQVVSSVFRARDRHIAPAFAFLERFGWQGVQPSVKVCLCSLRRPTSGECLGKRTSGDGRLVWRANILHAGVDVARFVLALRACTSEFVGTDDRSSECLVGLEALSTLEKGTGLGRGMSATGIARQVWTDRQRWGIEHGQAPHGVV
jgi:hypothetical protein